MSWQSQPQKAVQLANPVFSAKDETVIVPTRNLKKLLWLVRCCEQALAMSEGNDIVIATVDYQQRTGYLRQPRQAVITDAGKQSYWQQGVQIGSHVGHGGEGRGQHQCAGMMFRR